MDTRTFVLRVMELMPQVMKAFRNNEDNELASGTLTLPQFWALDYLSSHEKCKMKNLARHLRVSPAAVTGLIDRLRRQGLVTREYDSVDRRISLLGLSRKGSRTIHSIKAQRLKAMTGIFTEFSEEDRMNYLRTLERIAAHAASVKERKE